MKRIALFIITLFVCVVCYGATFNQYWYIGDGTYTTTSCTTGGDITLPTSPTKYGYDFIGWEKLQITPIEYIESTGTQWIDTLYQPNQNTRVKIKLVPKSLENGKAIWFGVSEQAKFFVWLWGGLYRGYGQQEASSSISIKLNDIIEIDFNKNVFNLKVNGVVMATTTFNTSTPFNAENMYVFSYNVHNGNYNTKMQLYYFQIYDNDILVRDFIPVLDEDGTPCLFDKVEQKIYYNAGTGDFIAGPVIGGE